MTKYFLDERRIDAVLLRAMQRAGLSSRALTYTRARFDARPDKTSPLAHPNQRIRAAEWLNAAIEETGDVTFAARTGLHYRHNGEVSDYIAKYSATLRDAIGNTATFALLEGPVLTWSLCEADEVASLDIEVHDTAILMHHRLLEFIVFAGLARMRLLTHTSLAPKEICLPHRMRGPISSYQALAGCSVRFGTGKLAIVISKSALDLPIPTKDANLLAHLVDYAGRLLLECVPSKASLESRVEAAVVKGLPDQKATFDAVAQQLGMSRRTLQRRLLDEGLCFRTIVNRLRNGIAKSLIKDNIRLAEVAFSLGYSDQSSFTTAFRRWNDMSPSAFRRKHRRAA